MATINEQPEGYSRFEKAAYPLLPLAIMKIVLNAYKSNYIESVQIQHPEPF